MGSDRERERVGLTGGRGALDRAIDALCQAVTVLGGLCVFAVAVTVFVSVFGRNMRVLSIPGDFEIVEIGSAVAIFLFFPICQLRREHVTVDLFTNWLPEGAKRGLDAIGELLFAVAWAVLVWRLTVGGIESYGYQDRSMILHVPTWIAFVPAVVALAISALVALRNGARLFATFGNEGSPQS